MMIFLQLLIIGMYAQYIVEISSQRELLNDSY